MSKVLYRFISTEKVTLNKRDIVCSYKTNVFYLTPYKSRWLKTRNDDELFAGHGSSLRMWFTLVTEPLDSPVLLQAGAVNGNFLTYVLKE